MKPASVLVVGQGYVGPPLAMRAVAGGFDVTGFGLDTGRVKRLAAGESSIEDLPDDGVLRATEMLNRARCTVDGSNIVRIGRAHKKNTGVREPTNVESL